MQRDRLLKYGILLAAFVCLAVFLQPQSGSQVQADGRALFWRELGMPASPWFHYERLATADDKTVSIHWRMEGWTWSGLLGVVALALFSWYRKLRRGTSPKQTLQPAAARPTGFGASAE